jgi:hypothetical protein
MGFERKVSSIQEFHCRIRIVASEGFCSRGNEKRIVFAPDRKKWRLRFAKILLKFRVKIHIRCVIQKQVELNLFVSRTFQQGSVQRVRLRRNALWIFCAMRVLPARSFQCQNILRMTSRFSVVGAAQYFRIGSQASPRPSSYAFPFCETMAITRSGCAIARRKPTGAP